MRNKNKLLLLAAAGSAAAAVLHLGCIVFGGDWYRFLGAGEQLAVMAESGHWYPPVLTLLIFTLLMTWSLYALSGAGLIVRLPFTKTALCLISLIYLSRGIGFYFIMPLFPGNSLNFWLFTSAICVALGGLYILGTIQMWPELTSQKNNQ